MSHRNKKQIQPLISVVIPLYNKAPYIKRALDSVFSQTVQDFEIVVVGGNSTDGGEEIVQNYCDSRIRFVKEVSKGVSAARNQGVDEARAELIAFLDADDEWLPEYLDTILKLKEKWPGAGLYSTARYYVDINGTHTTYGGGCTEYPADWSGIIPSVFRYTAIYGTFPGFTSSIAIPKNIFIEMKGFPVDISYGEDWCLWGKIALKYTNAHCSKPYVRYMHDDESAATKNISLFQTKEHPFQKQIDSLIERGELNRSNITYDLELFLNSLYFWMVEHNIEIGDRKNACKYLNMVKLPELNLRKIMFYVLIFIPKSLLPKARIVYNHILLPVLDYIKTWK